MAGELKDAEWVKNSFLLPKHAVDAELSRRRLLSDAALKFTDTSLGGNFAINPPPQFTEYADLRIKGRFSASNGMGRAYSEGLDDYGQLVHFRFGVASFNSLTQFFGNFYDTESATLARTGRSSSAFYTIGKALGFVTTLPLQSVVLAGAAIRFAINKPTSRYYYLKPTMPLYWNAVNTIANGIATNKAIVPRVHIPGTTRSDDEAQYTMADVKRHSQVWGGIFRDDGGVDIYAMSNRAQRLADKNRELLNTVFENSTSRQDLREKLLEYYAEVGTLSDDGGSGIDVYLNRYMTTSAAKAESGETESSSEDAEPATYWSTMTDYMDFAVAEARDGADFATFRVDYSGPASESFSSQTRASDLEGTLNGMSSGMRNARFSFADGNVGDGLVTGLFEGAVRAVADIGTGLMDSVSIGGLAALAGRALVDLPKHWDGSTADLPRMQYNMELRTPYGNKLSQFMHLYIPLSMILAGALPISTGMQSYTSPFLCQAFCEGRAQTRLGLIDSVSITRGVGNMGFNKDKEPLGIDISFSVVDLSSILHMPIGGEMGVFDQLLQGAGSLVAGDTGINFVNALKKSTYDDDNSYTDYLAILGNLSASDQIYTSRRLAIRLSRMMANHKAWKSKSHFAQWSLSGWTGDIIKMFARPNDRFN